MSIGNKEMARIKRALKLKKKLAVQNNLPLLSDDGKSRAKSEQAYNAKANPYASDSLDRGSNEGSKDLANVSIVDPSHSQIDKKKLQQLRAR